MRHLSRMYHLYHMYHLHHMFPAILAEEKCNAIRWDRTSLCDPGAHCFAMTHAMGGGRGCASIRQRTQEASEKAAAAEVQAAKEDAFYKLCGRNGVATGTYLPVVIDSGKQPPLLNVIARGSEPIGGGRRLVSRRQLRR